MDEPTAALTQKEVKKIFQIINNLKKKKVSFIYISHRLDEIFEIADSITVLRDGELIISDNKDKFTKSKLVQYMVGRPLDQIFYRSKNKIGDKILEVKNLSYENNFKEVNLELNKGEIVGLAGLIGAGRSELAQTIFGLRKYSSGIRSGYGIEAPSSATSDGTLNGVSVINRHLLDLLFVRLVLRAVSVLRLAYLPFVSIRFPFLHRNHRRESRLLPIVSIMFLEI